MTIPNISTNSLVDQTQLNQIIDTVNGISSKFANTISPIYNTATSQIVNSYMGTFAIATNQVTGNLTYATSDNIKSSSFNVSFGKTFVAAPLVFTSIQLTTNSRDSYVPGIIVSDVNQSGCKITVNGFRTITGAGTVPYIVSIMAVGLTQL